MNLKHGYTGTPTFSVWVEMRRRCRDQTRHDYARYGGRGITVDPRWEVFEHFLADMGEKPEGLTLERKNNDLPYAPTNCGWVTRKQQGRNRRTNVLFTIDGVTRCLQEWCEIHSKSIQTVSYRIKHGMDIIEALTTPLRH